MNCCMSPCRKGQIFHHTLLPSMDSFPLPFNGFTLD
nr:MAG TPA: hypothetical protein [Caudoviricetes sp.]